MNRLRSAPTIFVNLVRVGSANQCYGPSQAFRKTSPKPVQTLEHNIARSVNHDVDQRKMIVNGIQGNEKVI
jgi:hypothetical protein